jgi:hypothetical protein
MLVYLDNIMRYLPISSDDQENIEYLDYLKSAYAENVENKKYQFALLAFHMMFMSFIYKQFWCLKEYDFDKVKRFCDRNQQLSDICAIYDMSILKEKDSIAFTMDSLGFHTNRKSDVQQFVDTRDKCAHASGFIQYSERDVENHFIKVLEYIEQISDKSKISVQRMFELTLKDFWGADSFKRLTSAEKAGKIISQLRLSQADIMYIFDIDNERLIHGYEGLSYSLSLIIVKSVLLIRAGLENEYNDVDPEKGYLFVEISKLLSKITEEEFVGIEIEFEDEMNYLEQAYGTIPYSEVIKELNFKVAG